MGDQTIKFVYRGRTVVLSRNTLNPSRDEKLEPIVDRKSSIYSTSEKNAKQLVPKLPIGFEREMLALYGEPCYNSIAD